MVNHSRRQLLRNSVASLAAISAGCALTPRELLASTSPMLRKPIPGTVETIPVIVMGTWLTFDVPDQANLRTQRAKVLQSFIESGGGMIDSSPMYGYAEELLGETISTLRTTDNRFKASKIWTPLASKASSQMGTTEALWGSSPWTCRKIWGH